MPMDDEAKPSLLAEKIAEQEAELQASIGISFGDVFAGRTVVGVRKVDGKLFVSFGGNVWEAA